ncbi:MAG: SufE family protein [Henriciella sp.]|nr:SufE family protein [Henriciella sp.]
MTVTERAHDISAEFEFLDDWETRYAHIIDMGKANPPLDASERSEDTRVRGCASQVWMVIEPENSDHLKIRAESDALIVSGLIAILIRLYSGAKASEIAGFDAMSFFDEIGVSEALSAQRSNGLASMLERIKSVAGTEAAAG